MADGLITPFDYRKYLIGEEIIYRALLQQEEFANEGKFEMTWSERDGIDKSGMFFKSHILRSDFAITSEDQHCIVKPPCPWPKEVDELDDAHFNPIIMSSDGIYTYRFEAFVRIDEDNTYRTGEHILAYDIDQSRIDAKLVSEFTYFNKNMINPDYTGKAILQIKRLHRGAIEKEFSYLFDFK